MSTPNDGGPAFPTVDIQKIRDVTIKTHTQGMSLLDHFAGKALAGIEAATTADHFFPTFEQEAKHVYDLAEAMLAERERRAGITNPIPQMMAALKEAEFAVMFVRDQFLVHSAPHHDGLRGWTALQETIQAAIAKATAIEGKS